MPTEPAVPSAAPGLVVGLQANYCWVVLDRPGPAGESRLLCTRRTRLGKSGQTICVGDRVRVEAIDWRARRAAVAALEPRATRLDRPAVANVSRIAVVVSLAEPAPDPLQLTRFLLTAETTGCPVLLVFSKADLVSAAEQEAWCARGRSWGYDPLAVASSSGLGIGRLRERLGQPGITVLCGPSGVGKSSLLNALLPDLGLRVAKVSGRLQRGRHTTRHVELFSLAQAALVADTPGFNRPELPADPTALAPLFPEVRARLERHPGCRFSNCLHLGEPGCVVGIAWDRWPLYCQCLEGVQAESERLLRLPSREEGAGLRSRGGGLEPRLAPRLRQASRRRQRQDAEREVELNPDQSWVDLP